jgi:unsaturated chondroitin disaccharide hydrolase
MHSTLTRALIAAAAAALLVPPGASAAPLDDVLADDLAPPLAGWSTTGKPGVRAIALRDGRGLALAPGGWIRRELPADPWSLSLDVRVFRGSTLQIAVGGHSLNVRQGNRGRTTVLSGAYSASIDPMPGWMGGGWRHIQIVGHDPAEVHVDGTRVPHGVRPGGTVRIRVRRGSAQLTGLVATPRDDARALILHRLAELHARVPARRFPVGVGADDGRLRFAGGWTDGFWAGSLWRAYDLTGSPLFRNWAAKATTDHFGHEDEAIHDQGFRYLESSAASYDRTCGGRREPPSQRCRVLLKSTSKAARTLYHMWLANRGTKTIPTVGYPRRCRNCASRDEVETIVDGVMNLGLLDWEWARTGSKQLREVALTSARGVARLLVRGDGSTAQGVRTNRLDGTVLAYEHRQGLSADSTWARGQAWAIYGFARTGLAFRQADLLQVAERTADLLERRLPASRVPLYDFDAPAGSPEDTSAGVIAAAGLMRLGDACERMAGTCAMEPAHWRDLGRSMLQAALTHVDSHAPIGVLHDQVYSLGGSATWDDAGEYMFGVDYALEAIARERARPRG